jgi:hypothetical protein
MKEVFARLSPRSRALARAVFGMRQASVAIAGVGALVALPPVAAATVGFKPVSDKDVAPSSLGPVCNYHAGFALTDAINITVVQNQWEARTTLGPMGLKTTEGQVMPGGALVLTFSHVDQNGDVITSVTQDVSGSTTVTTEAQAPYHSVFEGHDRNWLAFGPNGRRLTGQPGLVFTNLGSHVTVESFGKSPAIAVNATITGGSVDGCRLLAAPKV